jgi:hypothetical protein
MRVTVDLADDVVAAIRKLARRDGTTPGRVLSDLGRQALTKQSRTVAGGAEPQRTGSFMGFRPFPSRGSIVTDELVRKLRDSE